MKITKSGLKQIIKEEYQRLLNEAGQIVPVNGKYYVYTANGITREGKYVEGKGFVRIQHEDHYRKANIEPRYDNGVAVKEIEPQQVASEKEAAKEYQRTQSGYMSKFTG